jgi:hypothetical protein
MSQVAIHKCKNLETTPQTLLEHLEAITDFNPPASFQHIPKPQRRERFQSG